MLLFIRRREEILHFQTTPSPSPPPKTTPSLSSFPKFLVSFLPASCCLSIPFVLARGEHRLSITIYSDSRSTSGSNLTGLCTLKNAYLRAPSCLVALNCKATRVSPSLWKNSVSRITVLWSRVKERGYRGFFELCILMQLPARFSIGVYRSHDNIFSIYLFSLE